MLGQCRRLARLSGHEEHMHAIDGKQPLGNVPFHYHGHAVDGVLVDHRGDPQRLLSLPGIKLYAVAQAKMKALGQRCAHRYLALLQALDHVLGIAGRQLHGGRLVGSKGAGDDRDPLALGAGQDPVELVHAGHAVQRGKFGGEVLRQHRHRDRISPIGLGAAHVKIGRDYVLGPGAGIANAGQQGMPHADAHEQGDGENADGQADANRPALQLA
jgi:hypothetical protein